MLAGDAYKPSLLPQSAVTLRCAQRTKGKYPLFGDLNECKHAVPSLVERGDYSSIALGVNGDLRLCRAN